MVTESARKDELGFRPLYQQVKDQLISRLIDREFAPGSLLPSEIVLAKELGVSQGTVRKALDTMAADNLVVRRQGRGTFVAEHDHERALFHFFKLTPDQGAPEFPSSDVIGLAKSRAGVLERERLALSGNVSVWRLDRNRSLDGVTIIAEQIVLAVSRFPELDQLSDIPNNVYGMYADTYEVTIARAEEQLKAVAAETDIADRLACEPGTPILQIDRVAYGLDGAPAEWRLSWCLTEHHHYLSNLK